MSLHCDIPTEDIETTTTSLDSLVLETDESTNDTERSPSALDIGDLDIGLSGTVTLSSNDTERGISTKDSGKNALRYDTTDVILDLSRKDLETSSSKEDVREIQRLTEGS